MMFMTKLKEKINRYTITYPTRFYVVILVLLCIICSLFTYNKIFPITGGFYSVAAKNMEYGMLPYKDFQLLFPPVYIYIIRLLSGIFGYDFIVIRIFGIFIFCLEAVLLFYIFKKIFNDISAFSGSLISVFMMQSGNAFTAYDYGRIHDVFIYVAILFLFAILSKTISYKKSITYSILCGICMGLTIATRQSSGILVAVTIGGLFVATILFLDNRKQRFLNTLAYCFGVAVIIGGIIYILSAKDMLSPFLTSTTTDALAAKGGIVQTLFGWMVPAFQRMWTSKLHIIVLCIWGIVCYKLYQKYPTNDNIVEKHALWVMLSGGFIVVMILSYASLGFALRVKSLYNDNIPYIIYFILFVSFFVLLGYFLYLRLKKNIINYRLILFLSVEAILIAISWGGAMSASLGFLTGYSTLGLLAALIIYYSSKIQSTFFETINLLIIFIVCSIFFCNKIVAPYSWWGLNVESADKLLYTVDLPYMAGIKTSKQTKYLLEEISAIIEENATDSDEIFSYPHMPIYYLLTNHQPFTYSYIQWFDVSSDTALINDMQRVRQVKPKVIILECLPDFVFAGHEKSFRNGNISQQRIMQEELLEFVESNNYSKVKEVNEQNDYVIQVFVKDYEETSAVSTNPKKDIYELNVTPEDDLYSVNLEHDSKVILDISKNCIRKVYVDGKTVNISEENEYATFKLAKGFHEIEIVFQEWSSDLVHALILFCGIGIIYVFIETYLGSRKKDIKNEE